MESLPRVVFLARAGRLKNEDAILLAVRARGYSVSIIREVSGLVPELDRENGRTIVIVDMMSTLYNPTDIKGYDDFLHLYGPARMTRDVNLFVIGTGTYEVRPDAMLGYGCLVSCYLTAPVNPAELVHFMDRCSSEEKFWLPLRHE